MFDLKGKRIFFSINIQKGYFMKKKEIAILMASYNGGAFIATQLDSILSQTYRNWKLYIHDDGSTDDTMNIIKKYVSKFPQKIFIVKGPRTGGAKYNFFYLMNEVNADYIMFSDQDDYWLPTKIEKTLKKLLELENNNPHIPVVTYTDLSVVDQNLKIISNKMSRYQALKMTNTHFNKLMIQNVVTGCTMMINKACRDLAIKCKDYDSIIMHDWWCALIASHFGKIGYLDEPLILYRQHGDNSVGAKKVYDIKYVASKINHINKQKLSVIKAEKQILLFAKTYKINKAYIVEYGNLNKRNKLNRIYFFIKHHIFKSGLIRNIGLFLVC